MEIRAQLHSYFNQLCEELRIPQIQSLRLSNSPSGSKKLSAGDFGVHMNQPSISPLKPHIQRIISDLPQISESWPLQISSVELKPECPYLGLCLRRPTAFQYLCQRIAETYAKPPVCGNAGRTGGERLVLVSAPEQDEFDSKKSALLMEYIQRLSIFTGFKTMVLEGHQGAEEGWDLYQEDLKRSPYYDAARGGFDLASFVKDRKLTGRFDASIGWLYENSSALRYAFALRRNGSLGPEDTICHVTPQSRSVCHQQIGLLLMLLGCQANQRLLVHGGVDGGSSSLEAYEETVEIYISNQLRQKQVAGIRHVGGILSDTKLTFDLMSIKQQNRVKIPDVVDNPDSNNFEGKGGLFVQYTCSRLVGLLKKYDRAIMQGIYPGCTPSNELLHGNIDWTLLSTEQEWNLLLTMLRFIDLLESLEGAFRGDDIFSRIDVKAHSVCEGLLNLCKEFSVFYSKVRILVEGQAHLLSAVECRIYFVARLLELIKCGLWLLGLDSVECM